MAHRHHIDQMLHAISLSSVGRSSRVAGALRGRHACAAPSRRCATARLAPSPVTECGTGAIRRPLGIETRVSGVQLSHPPLHGITATFLCGGVDQHRRLRVHSRRKSPLGLVSRIGRTLTPISTIAAQEGSARGTKPEDIDTGVPWCRVGVAVAREPRRRVDRAVSTAPAVETATETERPLQNTPAWVQAHSTNKALAGNFAPVEQEVLLADVTVSGVLPAYLDGVYLRNGTVIRTCVCGAALLGRFPHAITSRGPHREPRRILSHLSGRCRRPQPGIRASPGLPLVRYVFIHIHTPYPRNARCIVHPAPPGRLGG